MEKEIEKSKEPMDSEPANGGKLEKLPEQVKRLLQSRKGRIIACVCGAAILLLLVVLLVQCAGGNAMPEGWPTGELMEGVQPPEQGRISSVRQTEQAVTVYFAEFPESALAAYVKTLGALPAGDSTYVAQMGENRILAVVYDPATKQLSLTVTSIM